MKCPICLNKKFNVLYKIDDYEILKCNICSLVLLDSDFEITDIKNFYKDNYFNRSDNKSGYLNYFGALGGLEKTFSKRLEEILKFKKAKSILDIGSGPGIFLKVCKNKGIEAQGVEISEEAVDYAKNVLNVSVTKSTLEEFNPKEKFDLITAWDVIEHITDPNLFLQKVHKILNKNGCFIFSTGDINSIIAKISGKNWHLFTLPDHMFFYSKKSIKAILENNGFRVVKITYPFSWYSLSYLIERFLKKVLKLKNPNFVKSVSYFPPFERITVPFNLFDIMEVVTVRKNDE